MTTVIEKLRQKVTCIRELNPTGKDSIRDFPDHANFREKGAKLACSDKLGDFLSLNLCKKANLSICHLLSTSPYKKTRTLRKSYEIFVFFLMYIA